MILFPTAKIMILSENKYIYPVFFTQPTDISCSPHKPLIYLMNNVQFYQATHPIRDGKHYCTTPGL